MSIAVVVVGGAPNDTYKVASTDAAQTIAASKLTNGTGTSTQYCKGAVITVETNDIRYTFGSTPTQGAAGLGNVAGDGTTIKLNSYKAVKNFKFISYTNGAHATLQITVGF